METGTTDGKDRHVDDVRQQFDDHVIGHVMFVDWLHDGHKSYL
jgi:hypothetical protein